jgi:CheY-like chemotaxis protein
MVENSATRAGGDICLGVPLVRGGSLVFKVLIIDDDAGYCQALAMLLRRAGYAVVTEPNGARVESVVTAHRVKAVITDLYMPEADGLETLERLKRLNSAIPVIGMSGSVLGDDDPCLKAFQMLGATAVLTKPVDGSRLLTILAEILSHPLAC